MVETCYNNIYIYKKEKRKSTVSYKSPNWEVYRLQLCDGLHCHI